MSVSVRAYHQIVNNRLEFGITEKSPRYLVPARTIHDPCQLRKETKISQHAPPEDR